MTITSSEIADFIFREYVVNSKSDREIANLLGLDRTTVCKIRHKYGIDTVLRSGEIGEQATKKELEKRGFLVEDKNLVESKTYPFDLLVNNRIKIDVKSAREHEGCWRFQLTQKYELGISASNKQYTTLRNGRFKKIFNRSCDALIFCALSIGSPDFYIIPPNQIPIWQNTITISDSVNCKWREWLDNWDFISRLTQ